MIRLRYLTLPVLAVLIVVSIVVSTVPFVSSDVLRGEFAVPNWVKNTAGWWASDQIPDSSFIETIEFLIKDEMIIVKIPDLDSEVVNEIPTWVKNTAGWWAEDKIHDIAFVNAIKYLISQGIITVEQEVPEVEEPVEEVVEIKDFYMEINAGNCCVNWAYVNEEYRFEITTLDKKRGNYIDGVEINVKIISKGGELRQNLGAVTTEDGIYKSSITIPSIDWYAENILSVTGEYYGVEKTIEKEFTVFAKQDSRGPWLVTSIVARDAETDDANSFTMLNGARGVDVFTIDSVTYAIVASFYDFGVQLIDISDPTNIVAKDAETDDANSFTMLNGALDVDTFTIGSSTYAIVASYIDDGVQIIDITNPSVIVAKDAETDGENSFAELRGARGVDVFTIGSSTYAIVTSVSDDGVQIIDISDVDNIVAKDSMDDDDAASLELDAAIEVDTFTIGSSTYAIVAARQDNGVQIIDITNPSVIVAKDAETDDENGFTMLDGAWGIDTFTIGSSTYAIIASYDDDGVQMIDISDPDNIVALDAETDGANGFTELNGASSVDTFTCGSHTYAIVISEIDDGVQLIDISDPSNIVAVDAQTDDENGFTMLNGVDNIESFTIGSAQYAIATSKWDAGVQMIELACSRS